MDKGTKNLEMSKIKNSNLDHVHLEHNDFDTQVIPEINNELIERDDVMEMKNYFLWQIEVEIQQSQLSLVLETFFELGIENFSATHLNKDIIKIKSSFSSK